MRGRRRKRSAPGDAPGTQRLIGAAGLARSAAETSLEAGGSRASRAAARGRRPELPKPGDLPSDLHERNQDGVNAWYTRKGVSPSQRTAHASVPPPRDGVLDCAVPDWGLDKEFNGNGLYSRFDQSP